jgi:hypothetical protein
MSQIVAVRMFKAWLHPNWVLSLTPLGRKHSRRLRYIDHMISMVSVKL